MLYLRNKAGNQDVVDQTGAVVGTVGENEHGWWWELPGKGSGRHLRSESKAKRLLEQCYASETGPADVPFLAPVFPPVPVSRPIEPSLPTTSRDDVVTLDPYASAPALPTFPPPAPIPIVYQQAVATWPADSVRPSAHHAQPEIPMLASVPRAREQLLDQIRETTLEALRSHRGVVADDTIVADDNDDSLRDIVTNVVRLVEHAIDLAAAMRGRKDPARVAETIAQIASTTAQAIAGLLSQLSFVADLDDVVDTFRDIVEAAITAGTDQGGESDLDGDPFSQGLVALWKLAREYGARDPGNLQRRIAEADRLGQTRKSARLSRVQRRVMARQARRKG